MGPVASACASACGAVGVRAPKAEPAATGVRPPANADAREVPPACAAALPFADTLVGELGAFVGVTGAALAGAVPAALERNAATIPALPVGVPVGVTGAFDAAGAVAGADDGGRG
jgi:hypothetical protein